MFQLIMSWLEEMIYESVWGRFWVTILCTLEAASRQQHSGKIGQLVVDIRKEETD
jgi:hypothetical protein